jgi:hypothetical protein
METGVRRKATQEAMMKRAYLPFRSSLILLSLLCQPPDHAGMTYRQPPYIIQNAAPNILLESTSKNMNRFAYYVISTKNF